MDCRGYLPIALAQDCLDPWQQHRVDREVGNAGLGNQRLSQPVDIAARRFHVRFGDRDGYQRDRAVGFDVAGFRALADNLTVGLGIGRDIDNQIAQDFCLTGKAPVGGQFAQGRVAGFRFGGTFQVFSCAGQVFLGESAFRDGNLAAPANAAPATYRLHIDTERAGSVEQGRADRKGSTAPAGLENDFGLFDGLGHVCDLPLPVLKHCGDEAHP